LFRLDNLFERIGGPGTVEAAVDLFYRKVLMDDEISNFVDTTYMDG
jgi:hemoglobin